LLVLFFAPAPKTGFANVKIQMALMKPASWTRQNTGQKNIAKISVMAQRNATSKNKYN
jgi:hypothetical protein